MLSHWLVGLHHHGMNMFSTPTHTHFTPFLSVHLFQHQNFYFFSSICIFKLPKYFPASQTFALLLQEWVSVCINIVDLLYGKVCVVPLLACFYICVCLVYYNSQNNSLEQLCIGSYIKKKKRKEEDRSINGKDGCWNTRREYFSNANTHTLV